MLEEPGPASRKAHRPVDSAAHLSLATGQRGGGMADNGPYRCQLIERLEREKRAAQDDIVRAQAEEARARARVAEKDAAIASVRAAREPQADECKRCRFDFGRTSVLRSMPSKSRQARFQCALCGAEEERA